MYNHHFISRHFCRAFSKYKDMVVSTIYQRGGGWDAVLGCAITGKMYRVRIEEVKSEIEVSEKLTFNQVIKEIDNV